jgi:2-oxoglutarate/2-oxoacid ferredoxin oxidoreductase subunit alpha
VSEQQLVRGNEACALGALAAGCRFYAGYPITPSSEISEEMARQLPGLDGVFVQMEDEIASLAAVIGASLGGVKSMTATSGPGYSLMQEHVGFATMAEIPCVIVNVMRGGPSTGMPTFPSQGDVMQARWGTHGDHPAIVLVPASVREVFDLTVRAFNLSERFRNPVQVLYDEVIGHIAERVSLPGVVEVTDRPKPACAPADYLPYAASASGIPPLPAFGDGYRFHVTGLTHDERGFPTTDPQRSGALLSRLQAKVEQHADEIVDVEEFLVEDAEVVVFAYGIVARAAHDAVVRARAAGIRAGLLRPRVLWPFPDAAVAAVARRAGNVLVAEMNLGQIVHEVTRAAAGATTVSSLLRSDGEPITPTQIADQLMALPAPAGGQP